MNDSLLERASDYAFSCLTEAGGDIFKLPIPLQTVAIIYSAQGVIDNGGLEYFFESDFDGQPDYALFVSAYRRIGAENAASCIETTAAMFPFDQPHLQESKRLHWLDTVRNDESHLFVKLSQEICGDQTVFTKLAEYVRGNLNAFKSG